MAMASMLHRMITANMSNSEMTELTARAFGDLATVSMIISEIKKAGIDVSRLATGYDLQKALRSRAFKRYSKAKAKTAEIELEKLYEMERVRKARVEDLRQRKLENDRIIRGCKERMAARELHREELVRELEFARTERPALLEQLRIAREELDKIQSEDKKTNN